MKLGQLLILSGRMERGLPESGHAPRPTFHGTGSGEHWGAGVLQDLRAPACQFIRENQNRLGALARSFLGPKPEAVRSRHPLAIGVRDDGGGRRDRFSRLCLWLLLALLALAAVACGFGA